MVQNYDILSYRGCTLSLQITAQDSNNNPINLSGYLCSGYVRERYSSTGILLDLQPQIDPTYISGFINITVPSSGISNLPITQAVYDVSIYNQGNGYRTQVVRGYFNVQPEATR